MKPTVLDCPSGVSVDKLASLSRRALAAFAVRCALRAEPLIAHLNDQERADVRKALFRAQSFIAGIKAKAESTVTDRLDDQVVPPGPRPSAEWVAGTKAYKAAAAALITALERDLDAGVWAAAAASKAAAEALGIYGMHIASRGQRFPDLDAQKELNDAALSAAVEDFRCLVDLDLARRNRPLGDTLDLSTEGPLGTLWPSGLPEGLATDPLFQTVAAGPTPGRHAPAPALGTVSDKVGGLLLHMTWLAIVGTVAGGIVGWILDNLTRGLFSGAALGAAAGALLQGALLLTVALLERK